MWKNVPSVIAVRAARADGPATTANRIFHQHRCVSSPASVNTLLFGLVVGTEALVAWFKGEAVSGFTTTILTMLILSSFIMISLGIIGEYIAKIYDEIKQRPAYLIEATVGVPACHLKHSPKNYLSPALERDCN